MGAKTIDLDVNLRKKIEKNPAHPRYILTEPWVGYMFQLPPDMADKQTLRKV